MIAARPFTIPYLTALLPSELEIQQMEETDSSEQDEQTDTENIALHISTVGSPLLPASQYSQNSPSHILPLPLGTEQGLAQASGCLLDTCMMGRVSLCHERHTLGSHTLSILVPMLRS